MESCIVTKENHPSLSYKWIWSSKWHTNRLCTDQPLVHHMDETINVKQPALFISKLVSKLWRALNTGLSTTSTYSESNIKQRIDIDRNATIEWTPTYDTGENQPHTCTCMYIIILSVKFSFFLFFILCTYGHERKAASPWVFNLVLMLCMTFVSCIRLSFLLFVCSLSPLCKWKILIVTTFSSGCFKLYKLALNCIHKFFWFRLALIVLSRLRIYCCFVMRRTL